MITTLVLLAGLVGQISATPSRPVSLNVLADSSGKQWTSPDPVWLAKWVGIKNTELAARREARALPTGVVASRLPHVPSGKSWYGGNVADTTPTPSVTEPAKDTAPDVYLTVIGAEADRKAVMNDLASNPALADVVRRMGDRLSVHDYAPDDPMAADVGLPNGGKPDIVIQESDGRVRYRAHDNPGPAILVAEIRKADPKYDPANDPSGESGLGGLDRFLGNIQDQALVLVALAFLGFAVWWTRQ